MDPIGLRSSYRNVVNINMVTFGGNREKERMYIRENGNAVQATEIKTVKSIY